MNKNFFSYRGVLNQSFYRNHEATLNLKLKFQVKYAKVGWVTITKLNFQFVLQISSNQKHLVNGNRVLQKGNSEWKLKKKKTIFLDNKEFGMSR